MSGNGLSIIPSGDELGAIWKTALQAVQSGLMPPEVETQQQAFWLMLSGRDLGVPMSVAIRSIHIIKGKPGYSADLLAALALRVPGAKMEPIEQTSDRVTFEIWRPGWKEARHVSYTMEDAKVAGLTSSQMYRKFPRQMLTARCKAEAARLLSPETVANLYTPDELGAAVDEEGVPVSTEVTVLEPAKASTTPAPRLSLTQATATEPPQRRDAPPPPQLTVEPPKPAARPQGAPREQETHKLHTDFSEHAQEYADNCLRDRLNVSDSMIGWLRESCRRDKAKPWLDIPTWEAEKWAERKGTSASALKKLPLVIAWRAAAHEYEDNMGAISEDAEAEATYAAPAPGDDEKYSDDIPF